MDLSVLATPEALISLLMLTFMEVVLGIDNIIFISIASNKLPLEQRPRATNIGLILAMVFRIILLLGINVLIAMQGVLFHADNSFLHASFTGQSLILAAGGLFLLYKSTTEIHHKLESEEVSETGNATKGKSKISSVIFQITLINIVFSFDSILTAVGMTNGLQGALAIMITSVIISMAIMMLFANPVGEFVNRNPTIQMLGLAFLILIGFMLIAEGAHLAHVEILGQSVGQVPKGYLYFAIFFSLSVEFLNMRLRNKNHKTIQLKGYGEQAVKEGIFD